MILFKSIGVRGRCDPPEWVCPFDPSKGHPRVGVRDIPTSGRWVPDVPGISCGEFLPKVFFLCRSPKSIHQYCAKESSTNTWKPLWYIGIFLLCPFFPLENKLFGIHQTCFFLSRLKTPLVYTFFSPILACF